jgi:predicted MFS family arabinose efflux permease
MTAYGWRVALASAALVAIAMGGRNVFGVFVSPLNTATGLGLAAISLALATGQLGLGLMQPVLGHWADRSGARRVVIAGALVLMAAMFVPVLTVNGVAVFLSLVVTGVAASAVGSNGLLLGPVSRAAGPAHAALGVGLVGAGSSAGQLVLGPLLQWLIDTAGWRFALGFLGALTLLAFPLALALREPAAAPAAAPSAAPREDVRGVLREWHFWKIALSFAACGLHITFLGAHMPGAIERCGFPASLAGPWIGIAGAANIAGSIAVGFAMKRFHNGKLLAAVYLARVAAILLFLAAPDTVWSLMLFAVLMGATYMSALPPITALVADRYGTARLGTLFGVVMLVHQLGAFFGAWLGGWLAQHTGHDTVFWAIDMTLACIAACLVLPSDTWRRLTLRGPSLRGA